MTDSSTPPKLYEGIYAGKVLAVMAATINTEHSAFSSWMVAGFGAAIGLLIANVDKVAPYISPTAIGVSTKLFLFAVMLNVLQRYLGAIIAGSVATAKEVESIPVTTTFDVNVVLNEIERSTLWPMRPLVRWSNRRILAGDIAFGGRLNAWMAQVEAGSFWHKWLL
ncbi:hypothetical protein [Methylogaea oryzae]|uniref:hypothetical protein n=1 Tax=Methylogaea oryzae TaxID=1295382 RepID=UPI0006D24B24|nr:hypothetical protein [Methylogaea oryzae]